MLQNLKIEILKKNISSAKISRFLRIDARTMSQKVTEKSQFTRSEMYKIHGEFFSRCGFLLSLSIG